jgi:cell division protein FtsL
MKPDGGCVRGAAVGARVPPPGTAVRVAMGGSIMSTSNRRNERGFLTFTGVIMILVIVVVIFAAFKLLPPYIANYQLQDSINNISRSATYSTANEETVRNDVLNSADEIGVILDPSEVNVKRTRESVDIAIDYTVTVDLLVQQVPLHFTPSAGNRLITAK